MLCNYELHFPLGEIDCILLDIGTDLPGSGQSYYQHCHPGYELHYISDGYFEISSEKKKLRVSAGHVLLVPPGVYHHVTTVSENPRRMTLSIDMPHTPGQLLGSLPKEHLLCLPVSGTAAEADLDRIYGLAKNFDRSYLSVEKLRALCSLLVVDLLETLPADTQPDTVTAAPIRTVQEFAIDAFLGHHFMHHDAGAALAKNLSVSPRQLHRIMKKAYGMNYREKLKQIRMEIAFDFLANTDKSISEIAEILGYSSATNFSAFFKRECGKTPSQIRKEDQHSNP